MAKAASETTATGLATAHDTAVDTGNSLELVLRSAAFALDLTTAAMSVLKLSAESAMRLIPDRQ